MGGVITFLANLLKGQGASIPNVGLGKETWELISMDVASATTSARFFPTRLVSVVLDWRVGYVRQITCASASCGMYSCRLRVLLAFFVIGGIGSISITGSDVPCSASTGRMQGGPGRTGAGICAIDDVPDASATSRLRPGTECAVVFDGWGAFFRDVA
jgi:hypothetical protein